MILKNFKHNPDPLTLPDFSANLVHSKVTQALRVFLAEFCHCGRGSFNI